MAESPGQEIVDSGSTGTVPSPNQNPPQSLPIEEVAQETEVSSEGLEDSDEFELPKGVSERTKEQFEKLKAQNREYRQRLYGEQVFQSMVPPPPSSTEAKPLYDPITGLVDAQALNSLQRQAQEADKRAQRAEAAVQSYIDNSQTREAYQAYPKLNPKSDKFDETLHRTTRAFLMDSMVYPENYSGRQLSYKEAADLANQIKEPMSKQSEETQKEAEERMLVKEQASLGAEGRPSQGIARQNSQEEYERLRDQTRRGNADAMAVRMSNIAATPSSRPSRE